MAANNLRTQVLSVYKQILRESENFPSYNFRMYALRRTKDAFRSNAELSDKQLINEQLQFAQKNLEMIRAQVVVGKLYSTDKLVIEKK